MPNCFNGRSKPLPYREFVTKSVFPNDMPHRFDGGSKPPPLYNKVTHPKRVKNGIIEITLWIGSRPSDAGMRSVPVGYDHDLKREG